MPSPSLVPLPLTNAVIAAAPFDAPHLQAINDQIAATVSTFLTRRGGPSPNDPHLDAFRGGTSFGIGDAATFSATLFSRAALRPDNRQDYAARVVGEALDAELSPLAHALAAARESCGATPSRPSSSALADLVNACRPLVANRDYAAASALAESLLSVPIS